MNQFIFLKKDLPCHSVNFSEIVSISIIIVAQQNTHKVSQIPMNIIAMLKSNQIGPVCHTRTLEMFEKTFLCTILQYRGKKNRASFLNEVGKRKCQGVEGILFVQQILVEFLRNHKTQEYKNLTFWNQTMPERRSSLLDNISIAVPCGF